MSQFFTHLTQVLLVVHLTHLAVAAWTGIACVSGTIHALQARSAWLDLEAVEVADEEYLRHFNMNRAFLRVTAHITLRSELVRALTMAVLALIGFALLSGYDGNSFWLLLPLPAATLYVSLLDYRARRVLQLLEGGKFL